MNTTTTIEHSTREHASTITEAIGREIVWFNEEYPNHNIITVSVNEDERCGGWDNWYNITLIGERI